MHLWFCKCFLGTIFSMINFPLDLQTYKNPSLYKFDLCFLNNSWHQMLKLCLSFQRISYFVQIDSFSQTFSFLTYLYALSDLFGKVILDMHCNILSLQAYCSSPKFPYRKKSKTQDPSSADHEVQGGYWRLIGAQFQEREQSLQEWHGTERGLLSILRIKNYLLFWIWIRVPEKW